MKNISIIIVCSVLITIFALFLSPGASAISDNECNSCHGSYYQYLDLLEGNNNNQIPTTIMVGETKSISILIENSVNTNQFNTLSAVSVTLSSLSDHFSVSSPTYNVGNLPKGTVTVTWQITGVSAGTDSLLIDAQGRNAHNSISFSDSYDPNPSITVTQSPEPAPEPQPACARTDLIDNLDDEDDDDHKLTHNLDDEDDDD